MFLKFCPFPQCPDVSVIHAIIFRFFFGRAKLPRPISTLSPDPLSPTTASRGEARRDWMIPAAHPACSRRRALEHQRPAPSCTQLLYRPPSSLDRLVRSRQGPVVMSCQAGRHRSRQPVQATLISRLILAGRGQRLLRRPSRSAGTATISSMSGPHEATTKRASSGCQWHWEAMTVDPNDSGMESYARDLLFGQVAVAMEVERQALAKDGGGHRFFPFCSV